MIIKTEELKNVCSVILNAVDSNELSRITETLELKVSDSILYLCVTNKEYYVEVKLKLNENVDFHATVNANLFLKLIAKTTTEYVELNIENNLVITGNGKYYLPLIYDNDKLLTLPKIEIKNVTTTFNIKTSVLDSIYRYNSKELLKGTAAKAVQRLYYVDEKGCITFTSGACVNNFTLDKPVKLLFNDKLVKLFKLFKSDDVVFTLGQDALSQEIIQTKVRFENNNVIITAILSCDDKLIASVPVSAIRNRATNVYDYSVTVNRLELLDAVSRLMLFSEGNLKVFSSFEFTSDKMICWDTNHVSSETINYSNSVPTLTSYNTILDLEDLKMTLVSLTDAYINISFGDNQAIVIARNNVYNVIPECKVS